MKTTDRPSFTAVVTSCALGIVLWGAVILIASYSGCAKADDWNDSDRALYAATVALDAVDWSQTRRAGALGYVEHNPLIDVGNAGQVNRYFIATPILQYLIADALPGSVRPWFLGASLAVEVGSVAHNRHVGLSVRLGL